MKVDISVIIPVFNGEKYFFETLESLARQTFKNFEVIVVDDGSTDQSASIAENFTALQRKVIRQKNRGVGAALRTACNAAQGALLARMDADDRALPDRLERQKAFMDEHPDIGLVGSAVITIDAAGTPRGILKFPSDPKTVCKRLIARNLFCHPSVMMRADVVRQAGGYSDDRGVLDDYDLWLRMVKLTRMTNIEDPLLEYRLHSGSETSARYKNVLWRGIGCRWRAIRAGTYPLYSVTKLIVPLLALAAPKSLSDEIRKRLMAYQGGLVC